MFAFLTVCFCPDFKVETKDFNTGVTVYFYIFYDPQMLSRVEWLAAGPQRSCQASKFFLEPPLAVFRVYETGLVVF